MRFCQILSFLFFVFGNLYGQHVHRQTLSSQGGVGKTQTGIMATQSVGQQSTIGNYNIATLRIGQGFQQSKIAGKKSVTIESTSTLFAPNPFDSFITFTFSKTISSPITILIYDISGKIIYNTRKIASQNQLIIDNLNFPSGVYLVRLTALDYNFTAKIIKNK